MRARVAFCTCARFLFNVNLIFMMEIIDLFDRFGFSVALSVALLVFAYRFVNKQIKYLQDTVKELACIISKNTDMFRLLYDFLTKN